MTAADLRRVVNTYFKPENRTVAIYMRKPGTAKKEKETIQP